MSANLWPVADQIFRQADQVRRLLLLRMDDGHSAEEAMAWAVKKFEDAETWPKVE